MPVLEASTVPSVPTGAALAKLRRSTAFQCWKTTGICVMSILAQQRCSTAAQYWQTTNICLMPSIGAALDEYRRSTAVQCRQTSTSK